MTLPLPFTLDQQDWPAGRDAIQENFDAVATAMPNFGGASAELRTGIATVVWPGGVSLATELTVSHGLGRQPSAVLVTVQANGQGTVFAAHAGAYAATTFKVQAESVNGFAPGAGATLPVAWLAIG